MLEPTIRSEYETIAKTFAQRNTKLEAIHLLVQAVIANEARRQREVTTRKKPLTTPFGL